MSNYSIYLERETEKTAFMAICNAVGVHSLHVAGYGSGYNISLLATPAQAERINREWSAAV